MPNNTALAEKLYKQVLNKNLRNDFLDIWDAEFATSLYSLDPNPDTDSRWSWTPDFRPLEKPDPRYKKSHTRKNLTNIPMPANILM